MTDMEKQEISVFNTNPPNFLTLVNISSYGKVCIGGQEICSAEDWKKVIKNQAKIEAELLSARERIRTLEEALEFYADVKIYNQVYGISDIDCDCGNVAREALKGEDNESN